MFFVTLFASFEILFLSPEVNSNICPIIVRRASWANFILIAFPRPFEIKKITGTRYKCSGL